LADTQALTNAGLTQLIGGRGDLRIVGNISSRADWMESISTHQPDLLIVDYNLPGFVVRSDLAVVAEISPATRILVVSGDEDPASILDVLQAGVIGFVKKDSSRDEILMAIQAASKGEKFFNHQILNIIMERRFQHDDSAAENGPLTARETEILKLLASGYSTQRLADALFLSPHTVQTHRKSIIRKLNIKSPTAFVIHAMDLGLIKPK
jgi:DNA-binding NarL/FixJ family response regulator